MLFPPRCFDWELFETLMKSLVFTAYLAGWGILNKIEERDYLFRTKYFPQEPERKRL